MPTFINSSWSSGEYKAEEYSDAQGKWIINPETQIQILVEVNADLHDHRRTPQDAETRISPGIAPKYSFGSSKRFCFWPFHL